MKRLFSLLILLPCLFSSIAGHAQGSVEVLGMAVEMAENNYNFRPADDTLSDLIIAYEKYIAARCMPKLKRTLRHVGGTLDSTCRSSVKKLEKIFPSNPVATCAGLGIDAVECDMAYEKQQLQMLSARNIGIKSYSSVVDLDFKLAVSQEEAATTTLKHKYSDLLRKGRRGMTQEELVIEKESIIKELVTPRV